MARHTVHVPDELDERVLELTSAADSYSSIVQDALRDWCEKHEAEQPADD